MSQDWAIHVCTGEQASLSDCLSIRSRAPHLSGAAAADAVRTFKQSLKRSVAVAIVRTIAFPHDAIGMVRLVGDSAMYGYIVDCLYDVNRGNEEKLRFALVWALLQRVLALPGYLVGAHCVPDEWHNVLHRLGFVARGNGPRTLLSAVGGAGTLLLCQHAANDAFAGVEMPVVVDNVMWPSSCEEMHNTTHKFGCPPQPSPPTKDTIVSVVLGVPTVEEFQMLRSHADWDLAEAGISRERAESSLQAGSVCVIALAHLPQEHSNNSEQPPRQRVVVACARMCGDLAMFGYVQDVVVHAAYRRRGLGTKMLAKLLGEISEPDFVLGTCPSRAAVPLYTKAGFSGCDPVVAGIPNPYMLWKPPLTLLESECD